MGRYTNVCLYLCDHVNDVTKEHATSGLTITKHETTSDTYHGLRQASGQGQGQRQGLVNWSSKILEDKDFHLGQQHCMEYVDIAFHQTAARETITDEKKYYKILPRPQNYR